MTRKPFPTAKAALLAAACLMAAAPARAAGLAEGRPPPDRRPFHFAVMGCAHMGLCGPGDFPKAAARMKELKPDLVIFLGGMVDAPRNGDVEAQWREFDAAAAGIGAPVHNVPGACGCGPLKPDAGLAARSGRCFLERYRKRYYSFVFRKNLFICLDTDAAGGPGASGDGALDAGQLEFLKRELAGSAGFENVFLFAHNAQWLRENLAKSLGDAYQLLRRKGKYVFGAKEHAFNVEKAAGLSYVTTGSPPCLPKTAQRPAMSHFLDVSVDGREINIDVIPLAGVPIEKFDQAGGKGRKASRTFHAVKTVLMESAERKLILPGKEILAAMGIRPGLRIADVGAGTGLFAFQFAEAMNGAGMVYATETDPDMVADLKRAAAEKGVKNLTPVAVSAEGTDPFYGTQTFDIMFFLELYQYLDDPAAFFRALKPSLAPGTGRAFLLHFRNVPDFGEMEFDDFTRAIKLLRGEKGGSSPAIERLRAGLEDFRGGREEAVPKAVRERLVANFNALLREPGLFAELSELHRRSDRAESPERGAALFKNLPAHDLNLARWLVKRLEAGGSLRKKAEELAAGEAEELKALNRILLAGVFKLDKLDFIRGVYPVYAEKARVLSDMEAAGYKLVREHDFLTYHYLFEFQ